MWHWMPYEQSAHDVTPCKITTFNWFMRFALLCDVVYFFVSIFNKKKQRQRLSAMDTDFTVENSSNLLKIDIVKHGIFFAMNNDFWSTEFRNIKTSMQVHNYTKQRIKDCAYNFSKLI